MPVCFRTLPARRLPVTSGLFPPLISRAVDQNKLFSFQLLSLWSCVVSSSHGLRQMLRYRNYAAQSLPFFVKNKKKSSATVFPGLHHSLMHPSIHSFTHLWLQSFNHVLTYSIILCHSFDCLLATSFIFLVY